MDQLIDDLMKIGFSQNESKAYLSLLRQSPVTGYELSKQSGVPRSMIYQTINKLIAHGAIHEVRSEPVTYTPIPPKEFIGRLREAKNQVFDSLEDNLESLQQPPEVNVIRHIREREQVLQQMITLLSKSRHEVWLSIWDSEIEAIAPYSRKALDSGVRLYSLLFHCEQTSDFGKTFYHNPSTAVIEEQRMKQRLTIVVSDDEEVIIAGFSKEVVPFALHTQDPMLILLAKEYIRHDMMMKVLTEKMGVETLKGMYEKEPDLFYIITNKLLESQ
ncbi:TrmB family transcriptional regulator [Brevibacillus sp. 179-C9.3 HS]|uniref:TrmB family transcriptional regulator n=1 Tax=unclassified Brevibacillus TaxID=2684853 RepID=UPI0039A0A06E